MFLLVGYMNVILHIWSPQQIHLKYVYNACSLIQKTAHTPVSLNASHTRSALPHAVRLTDESFTQPVS